MIFTWISLTCTSKCFMATHIINISKIAFSFKRIHWRATHSRVRGFTRKFLSDLTKSLKIELLPWLCNLVSPHPYFFHYRIKFVDFPFTENKRAKLHNHDKVKPFLRFGSAHKAVVVHLVNSTAPENKCPSSGSCL